MAEGPYRFRARTEEALAHWQKRKEALKEANKAYQKTLPKHRQGPLGRLGLFLMEELIVVSSHFDSSYVEDLSEGFTVTGDISSGGCGEEIPGGQRVHRKPGLGASKPVADLKSKFFELNQSRTRIRDGKNQIREAGYGLGPSEQIVGQDPDRHRYGTSRSTARD